MMTQATPLSTLLSGEKEKILACVHCGLCLQSCPTYLATGNENDGPRGRIYLMRAVGEGRLKASSETFERHIDRCLGCRACEQVCPSGVEYGELLELSRAEIRVAKKRPGLGYVLQSRLLKHVWPYPKRLAVLFWSAKVMASTRISWLLLKTRIPSVLFPRVAVALALVEASRPVRIEVSHANEAKTAAPEMTAGFASLFKGCVTDGLFARVNDATQRVLRVNGFVSKIPPEQACCGALHLHSGDIDGARALARRNIDTFGDGDSPVITNAGGCGAMLVNYSHLLKDDQDYSERARSFSSRVKDISQVVDMSRNVNGCQLGTGRITYDASCHLLYGQKASGDALQMLASAAGPSYVPLTDSDVCCGGAGVYNLLEPELSSIVLSEKLRNVKATGANILATGNPGCHMQIGAGAMLAGIDLKVCHPVEVLDECYRAAGVYEDH